jgi:hypothetical protein
LTVLIGIFERHILKRPISLKTEIGVLLVFVFFACFQTWRDQYERANGLQSTLTSKPSQPPFQVNVLPAQVIVQPSQPLDKKTVKMLLDAIGRKQTDASQPALTKQILTLSHRILTFALEREKSQPQRPSTPRKPGPPMRQNPEWQKYSTDLGVFATQSREQYSAQFDKDLDDVFSQLKAQGVYLGDTPTTCGSNNASNLRTVQQCGDELHVLSDEAK